MDIVFASSEMVPFAKTGGLADVCGALPFELAALGHSVTCFLPKYTVVNEVDITLDLIFQGNTLWIYFV